MSTATISIQLEVQKKSLNLQNTIEAIKAPVVKTPILRLGRLLLSYPTIYIGLLFLANKIIKNETCGFCELEEGRNSFLEARKRTIVLLGKYANFVPRIFRPPLQRAKRKLEMAQEYWENYQEDKGQYKSILAAVAKKYSTSSLG